MIDPTFLDTKPAAALPSHLVVFDGVCVMCSFLARFLTRVDRQKRFRFATAQSPLGAALFQTHGLRTDSYDSALVLIEGQASMKLDGFTAVARALGWPWKAFTVLELLPQRWRDGLYDVIARNRYAMFGRKPSCEIPSGDLRGRLID